MNNHYINAIKIEEPVMCAGIKLFLIKLLYVLGEETSLPGDIRTISKALGLNDRMVSKALHFLLDEELLERKYISRTGKGRASSQIHIGEKLTSALRRFDGDADDNLLKPLIDLLLGSGKGLKTDVENDVGLGVSAKALLITLLACSDERGVVDQLGQSKLGLMAGLKKEALIKQIEGLLAKGFIRSYVPGFTRENLFGKAKGIYFLNLRHKFYQDQAVSGRTLIFVSQAQRNHDLHNEAELLHNEARSEFGFSKPKIIRVYELPLKQTDQAGLFAVQKSEINLLDCWEDIRPFFTPARKAPIHYFQARLELLVSDLLSNYWAEIVAVEFPEISQILLMATIDRYFMPKKFFDEKHQGFPSKAQCQQFRTVIFELALSIAKSIRKMLIATGQFFDAKRYNLLLIPASELASKTYGTGIVTLEIFPKDNAEGQCKCGVLMARGGFTIDWRLEKDFGILPYQVGLLTHVKKKTGKLGSVSPISQSIDVTLEQLGFLQ